MSRLFAREVAMKTVYTRMFGGEGKPEDICEQMGIEPDKYYDPAKKYGPEAGTEMLFDEDDYSYTLAVTEGVLLHQDEIDELIGKYSNGWSLERIAKVDLAILRVCIYELYFRPDIPRSASINAAVELAKSFGEEKSSSFINGILGSVERAMEPENISDD